MPGRRARVSVVIPSYNYGRYLNGAVHSALSQPGVDTEVIIVDDASDDDSAVIAERLAAADPRVIALRHRLNAGHTATFNTGYAVASGEFIARLDSDDQLTPGSLARSVALFDAFPDVGLVYGHPVHFAGAVPAAARDRVRSWSVWPGEAWIARRCQTGVNCITSQEAVVRASVMRQVGPLATGIRVASDFHLWLRLAAVSDVGRVNGCDQAFHRVHPASITHRAEYSKIVDLNERKAAFDAFFTDSGRHLSHAVSLAATARAQLADEALEEACRAYDRGRTATVDVAAFVEFALATCPTARSQPHWRALRRRELLGPRLSAAPPFFTTSLLWRRVRHQFQQARWRHTGI
jgi:Glycosyl transferase family 2